MWALRQGSLPEARAESGTTGQVRTEHKPSAVVLGLKPSWHCKVRIEIIGFGREVEGRTIPHRQLFALWHHSAASWARISTSSGNTSAISPASSAKIKSCRTYEFTTKVPLRPSHRSLRLGPLYQLLPKKLIVEKRVARRVMELKLENKRNGMGCRPAWCQA